MAVHPALSLNVIVICLLSPVLAGLFDEYSCSSRSEVCMLKDVVLESDRDVELSTFRDIRDPLVIESGAIPKFSQALYRKLPSVVDLTVDRLGIVQLFIRPGLMHLSAVGNAIEKVLLEDTEKSVQEEYSMLVLRLSQNKLTELPPLERFVRLMHLALDANQLSSVDMSAFAKLTNLRILSLAHNRLLTVTSSSESPLQLIKLRRLSFAENQLPMLNVSYWEFDSLENLNVTGNSMTRIEGSLTQFPVLKRLALARNQWYCEWLMLQYTYLETPSGLQLDADEPDRCRHENMMTSQHHCCNPAGAEDSGLIDLFGDKWDELKRLSQLLDKLNTTIANGSASVNRVLDLQHAALSRRVEKLTETQDKQTAQLVELKSGIEYQKDKLSRLETDLKDKVDRLSEEVNARWNSTDAAYDDLFNATTATTKTTTNWPVIASQNEKNLSQLRQLLVTTSKQFNTYSNKSYEQDALLKAQFERISTVQQELDEVRGNEKQVELALEKLEPQTKLILDYLTVIRKGCIDEEQDHEEDFK
ncbi:uncharacterized protein LOC128305623 [Anopheles moucheti]|uniref:uncharacterized protein LOC128305623 n=1 Tax=Anopheles moucheti TaxID=186751 RepID=UPI0022F0FCD3|nr:uncharacterized protein LOC128305623 [Anopheles moucheti]